MTLSWLGCKAGNPGTPTDMAMAPPPPTLAMACSDSVAGVYQLPDNLPAYDATHRGDVIRCAYSTYFSAAQLGAQATALGYVGPALTSGAWVFKIAYRTERIVPAAGGTAPEGESSALLFVPDAPRPNGPLVVYAHGSAGMNDACAPSLLDLMAPPSGEDFRSSVLALAGYGWNTIAPDYAGFGYGQPPSWSVAEDEAHSVLDASRAAAKLLPSAPTDVAIAGHSQGGHAALAAQAYAKTYGLSGRLVGVVTFAPLWISSYSWAGIINPLAQYTVSKDSGSLLYGMEYFYSHGELYDGPGGGMSMFQSAKSDAIKQVLYSSQCLNTSLASLGSGPADFYDQGFIDAVSPCGIGPIAGACTGSMAATWTARFSADRPAIDTGGAPIAVWSGGLDDYLTPGRAQCAFDKLQQDIAAQPAATVKITSCFDMGADHRHVVSNNMAWANQWIAARVGLGPEAAACAPFPTGTACATPPPNL